MRIRRLYGVNGHRRQSHGGKAGILSDHLVKANDCQQKKGRKSAVVSRFSTTRREKKLHFLRRWLMKSANRPG
ncbi:hypothetical protein DP180_05970 [Enterobacter kobei]|uniref:Uncharacterized protein n=1 Tax=Enterobacter kobei TaxID=208224 RepID=A0ABX9F8H3_9ENTR|nr:hypothetical protein D9T11_02645 [Enterobacter kobei]PYZ35539.1 hypothetical protein DNK77_17330 [Enterobacter cloacae complex sp.]RGD11034.1 hypothetical protein DW197_18885 [Enterobacter sp. AM17-18]OWG35658.1 hypothetical protein CAL36_00625 [Enterobacter kobei]OXV42902.1 hypothetical protein CDL31_00045 [Enterobacter kobei]